MSVIPKTWCSDGYGCPWFVQKQSEHAYTLKGPIVSELTEAFFMQELLY